MERIERPVANSKVLQALARTYSINGGLVISTKVDYSAAVVVAFVGIFI